MSTTFFWDKEQKEFLLQRRGTGLKDEGLGKKVTFIFKNKNDLIKFLEVDGETTIVDDCGALWNVGEVRKQLFEEGCIVFGRAKMEFEEFANKIKDKFDYVAVGVDYNSDRFFYITFDSVEKLERFILKNHGDTDEIGFYVVGYVKGEFYDENT